MKSPVLSQQQFYLFGQIQTSQTGGQLYYSVTSPNGECSLLRVEQKIGLKLVFLSSDVIGNTMARKPCLLLFHFRLMSRFTLLLVKT